MVIKSSEIVKKVKELQNIDLDDVLVGKKTGVEEIEQKYDKEIYSIYMSKTGIKVIEELE